MNTQNNIHPSIRGWKATYGMKCRDQEYEIGQTYRLPNRKSRPEMCIRGFHFCQRQRDVLWFYEYKPSFILLEVEAVGEVVTEGINSVTEALKIIRVVPKEEWEFLVAPNTVRQYRLDDTVYVDMEYDEKGRLSSMYYSCNNFSYIFEYDEQDRRIASTRSDGVQWIYKYDGQERSVDVVRREIGKI